MEWLAAEDDRADRRSHSCYSGGCSTVDLRRHIVSENTHFDLMDEDLSDEALDEQRERYCMASCGCQGGRFSVVCR